MASPFALKKHYHHEFQKNVGHQYLQQVPAQIPSNLYHITLDCNEISL